MLLVLQRREPAHTADGSCMLRLFNADNANPHEAYFRDSRALALTANNAREPSKRIPFKLIQKSKYSCCSRTSCTGKCLVSNGGL